MTALPANEVFVVVSLHSRRSRTALCRRSAHPFSSVALENRPIAAGEPSWPGFRVARCAMLPARGAESERNKAPPPLSMAARARGAAQGGAMRVLCELRLG